MNFVSCSMLLVSLDVGVLVLIIYRSINNEEENVLALNEPLKTLSCYISSNVHEWVLQVSWPFMYQHFLSSRYSYI